MAIDLTKIEAQALAPLQAGLQQGPSLLDIVIRAETALQGRETLGLRRGELELRQEKLKDTQDARISRVKSQAATSLLAFLRDTSKSNPRLFNQMFQQVKNSPLVTEGFLDLDLLPDPSLLTPELVQQDVTRQFTQEAQAKISGQIATLPSQAVLKEAEAAAAVALRKTEAGQAQEEQRLETLKKETAIRAQARTGGADKVVYFRDTETGKIGQDLASQVPETGRILDKTGALAEIQSRTVYDARIAAFVGILQKLPTSILFSKGFQGLTNDLGSEARIGLDNPKVIKMFEGYHGFGSVDDRVRKSAEAQLMARIISEEQVIDEKITLGGRTLNVTPLEWLATSDRGAPSPYFFAVQSLVDAAEPKVKKEGLGFWKSLLKNIKGIIPFTAFGAKGTPEVPGSP